MQFTRSSARHHALSPAGASGHGMPHSDGFRSIRRSSESHPSRPTTWFRSGRSDAFQPTRELQRIAHSLDYRIATELTSAAYSGISSENLALSPAAAGSPQDGQDALGLRQVLELSRCRLRASWGLHGEVGSDHRPLIIADRRADDVCAHDPSHDLLFGEAGRKPGEFWLIPASMQAR